MAELKKIFKNRVVQHIAFWIAMVVMFTVNYVFAPGVQNRRVIGTFVFLPAHIFFVYIQMYWAIPRYLLKRKYKLYGLYTFLFLTICVSYSHLAQLLFLSWETIPVFSFRRYFNYKYYFIGYGRSAFALLFTAGLAVAIKLTKEWFHQRENALRAENEKVKIELESLRSQIHPHFLFNTLNNLYSLTLSSSANASLVVVHLSDLLRYMLYECKESEVSIDKELQMLKKYLELEKLRYGNRLDVAFKISGNINDLAIAPLLLLPFIENSFKHGVSEQIGQCWINIYAHVESNIFTFQVSNSRLDRHENTFGGLGMENVRKRLQLLYPATHTLIITEDAEIYVVKLELKLNRLAGRSADTNPSIVQKAQPVNAV